MTRTKTVCPFCGCGCVFYLVSEGDRVTGIEPSSSNPINKGMLCIKGWNVHAFVNHPDRLTKPLIRKNGKLEEATWDEALTLIADKLGEIKARSGPDSIALLSSAKCTNEENYLLQKFARAVIGTNNIDHCARL